MPLLQDHPQRVLFIIFLVCEFLGGSGVIIVTFMLTEYFGGCGMSDPGGNDKLGRARPLWNIHGVFMTVGFLFLLGNGIVMYRLFRDFKLKRVKWVHIGIMTLAFIFITLGMITAIQGNSIHSGKHFTTLHSWCGLLCTILFFSQYCAAFPLLVFKVTSVESRDYFAALHAFFGVFNLLLSMVIVCIGIGRKNFQAVTDYGYYSWQAIIMNYAGLAVTFFVAVVLYITVNPFFEYEKVEDI